MVRRGEGVLCPRRVNDAPGGCLGHPSRMENPNDSLARLPVRLAIIGAQGRMGQALVQAIRDAPRFRIAALVVHSGDATVSPIAEVPYSTDLSAALAHCDVAIEFAGADSIAATATACAMAGKPLVSGSTGLDAEAQIALDAAAAQVAVLHAPNFSPGVTVLVHLVGQAARALPEFAVEIDETHHVHKKDSPSGTALRLRGAVRAGRGPDAAVTIRSQREGDAIGDHRVVMVGPGERLELAHHADERAIFARGALAAAAWLADRPAGRYSMADVLGLLDTLALRK